MSEKKPRGKRNKDHNKERLSDAPTATALSTWQKEVILVLVMAACLLLVLALASYQQHVGAKPVRNCVGVAGHYCAWALLLVFGQGAFLLVPGLIMVALAYLAKRSFWRLLGLILGFGILLLLSSALLHGLEPIPKWLPEIPRTSALEYNPGAGGILGGIVHSALEKALGPVGSLIILVTGLLLIIHLATGFSYLRLAGGLATGLSRVKRLVAATLRWLGTRLRRGYYNRLDREEVPARENPPRPKTRRKKKVETEEDGFSIELKPQVPVKIIDQQSVQRGDYVLPPLSLLQNAPERAESVDQEELYSNAAVLERKLKDFNIDGKVTDIRSGPVVSCYELAPAPGVKISRIMNLADDIALALKAKVPPLVAPVPGKSVLGVEIPNQNREIVYFKEIIGSQRFQTSNAQLRIALGKDTRGDATVTALEGMPHLLIAGATGSGKSVCINVIMLSFLLTLTPDDLRLILVDPKMLELSDYNQIPHLRTDVITDVKMAPAALQWAVQEMEDRFHRLAASGSRSIKEFNRLVEQEKQAAALQQENGDEASNGAEITLEHLPYLVIIIDELADLMIMAAREVEEHIARIAQMGRAVGIHLILATQRPSVDVITGLIKANMPARIAFQVSSKVDSRVIIDVNGAERLLGMGDMLFMPPGTGRLKRLHGAYVNDKDIKKVVEFWSTQPRPEDNQDIFEEEGQEREMVLEDLDDLFDQAVRIVVSTGIASISLLQRRLRIGHARAARLIDQMELNRIVGPFTGSKAREVLITLDDLDGRSNL
ncbi:DNA translocase FtsK 4TM domain-containing protein [bacterium]|nr:DNA translocase FtsK 4TM domain-containing protein [candidate division CSSED10-310 bacterium]